MVRNRRGVVALVVVLLVVGLVVWRTRGDDAPVSTAKVTEASRVMHSGSSARTKDARLWFAKAGVAGRRIAGKVTSADGAPVRGAAVRLANAATRARITPEPSTDTDDAGRFDFGVQPALMYLVTADAPGLTGVARPLDLGDPTVQTDQLRLVLHPCVASIHGTIRDSAGGVIAGARISGTDEGLMTNGGAEAGDDGAYELCVPPGGVFVAVRAEGYATLVESVNVYGRTRRDFELVPGTTVTGCVVRASDKAPVAGALVELRGTEIHAGVLLHATSGDDGRFEIEGVATGRHQVTATADGLASAGPVEVIAELGTPPAEIECPLIAAYTVSGKVVEKGGKPVAGAEVMLMAQHRGSGGFQRERTREDGSFVIEGVIPGDYTAGSMPSRFSDEEPRQIKVEAANVTNVNFEVAPHASISGRILRGGKPVEGARVQLEFTPFITASDHEGRYLLRGIGPEGTYRLYAESKRDGAFARREGIAIAPGDAKTGMDLELDLAGSIEGVIVDQNDAPVAGVFLSFTLLGGTDYGQATTADDGSFAARALSGGGDYAYEVRQRDGSSLVFAPATGKRFSPVTVANGNTHVTGLRIKIRYERFSITGRVVDAAGKPIADVTVGAIPKGNRHERPARVSSDQSGSFTLKDLQAGTYDVFARSVRGDAREENVDAGRKDLVFRMTEFAGIEGRLDGFDDKTIVVARSEKGSTFRANVTGATFKFRDVPAGTFDVMAKSELAIGQARVTTTPGATTQVTIAKQPSGTLEVRLVDASTRAPIPNAYCVASPRGVDGSSSIGRMQQRIAYEPEDDGSYRMSALIAGPHTIECQVTTAHSTGEAVVSADQVTRLELTMSKQPARNPGTLGMQVELQLGEVRVMGVVGGGPAARAGLAVGDVVVQVDKQTVKETSAYAAIALLDDRFAGDQVTLVIERDDKPRTITLVYEPAPE